MNRPSLPGFAASALAVVLPSVLLHASWLARAVRLQRTQPRPEEADPFAPASLLSCVLRLPPSIAHQLRAYANELEGLEPDHYYYPPESMHVTLAAPRSTDDARIAVTDVRAIAPLLVGAHARVLGVGLTKRTLFAAIVPDRSLLAARRSLRRSWRQSGGGLSSDVLFGRVWYANIVRFRADPSKRYLARARKTGSLRFGWFELAAVEVVRTNKVMSPACTVVLARIPIEPRHSEVGQAPA